jgi:hypothetical protein
MVNLELLVKWQIKNEKWPKPLWKYLKMNNRKNLIFKKISKYIKNSEIARIYYVAKWLNRLDYCKKD